MHALLVLGTHLEPGQEEQGLVLGCAVFRRGMGTETDY